ncbi:MAG: NAD(P)-dependent oxidoreductase [Candidatus Brocadiaceae bacterium]|nr:NAD(P)-dependent oxidoreductase [Candidatus Brocadiaceae bacterium]
MRNSLNRIQRVLIIGHTGFIGHHLVEAFRTRLPDVKVDVLSRSIPRGDLTLDVVRDTLEELFHPETTVIMCSTIKRQFGDNLDVLEKNIKMSMNICRVLEEKPVARFIFLSSTAVYGEDIHNTQITEETPVQPTSFYGLAKYTSECMYRNIIGTQKQSSLVVLRPPTVYGPGDEGGTYGPVRFCELANKNESITIWGDGTELREFVFVDDLVNVIIRLVYHDYEGLLNVVSGKSYSFQEILSNLSKLIPHELKIDSQPRSKRKVDNAFDNSHLISMFPDISFTPLCNGMKDLLGT